MAGALNLTQLNHINLQAPAHKVDEVRRFYTDVIGLRDGPIPGQADFPVHWLYLGEQPVIHLVGRPAEHHKNDVDPKPTGWLDHVAFSCTDVKAARTKLDELGVTYVFNEFPQAGIAQFLLNDPLGVKIELNFFGEDR